MSVMSLAQPVAHGGAGSRIADDLRHRVIVVDRATKAIIWQYGETDRSGHAPGYLFDPDGFDLDVFRDWRRATVRP